MRRTLFAFALAVPLVTTPPPRLVDPFRAFFSSLWGSPATTPQRQPKEGCHIDPSSRCVRGTNQSPILQPKAGCNIDPDGRCIP